jgi:RHH-type transcriptional regulator, rel operon repressor / antitoxin RelB
MSTLKTISFRIPSGAVETLDELAESLDRDRSYLLKEAVEQYLELNEYHTKLIAKGLRAAKERKFVPHAEVRKMIQKLGRNK